MFKNISSLIVASLVCASSAVACPSETYKVGTIALDANGILTRTEKKFVPSPDPANPEKSTETSVVTDRMTVGYLDEITLNAAPGMQDASVQINVKRESQKSDAQGIFYTTYRVREIWTSYWGKATVTERHSLVKVKSTYLGEGKRADGCGGYEKKDLPINAPQSDK